MADNHEGAEGRRPLKVRHAALSQNFAKWLTRKKITPNQISITSLFFAGLSAACFFSLHYASGPLLYLLPACAAVFIQCRLLCNLFDGMVAVEGGKRTRSGELFNDIPDRIADPLILIAVGYSITIVSWGSSLGWLAAVLAVMTAYVRTLSVSIGAPTNFSGPMAKQHRMAIVTIACLTSIVESFIFHKSYSMLFALIIIALGCIVTVCRRAIAAYNFLENNDK